MKRSEKKVKNNTLVSWIFLITMIQSILIQPMYALGHERAVPYRDHIALVHQWAWNFKNDLLDEKTNHAASIPNTAIHLGSNEQAEVISSSAEGESNVKIFSADLHEGTIGYDAKSKIDDPSDNLFRIDLGNDWNTNTAYELVYDLYGLESSASVSRSINARVATGGVLIKKNNSWTRQRETLDAKWLHSGINTILFTVPSTTALQYRVKNVRIEIKKKSSLEAITVVEETNALWKDDRIYLKGFVANASKEWTYEAEGQLLSVRDGEFEGLIRLKNMLQESIVLEAFEKGVLKERKIIAIREIVPADEKNDLGVVPSKVAVMSHTAESAFVTIGEASVLIPSTATKKPTQIVIQPLRDIDVAPTGVALINVTRNHKGFRMLPDGTKFETAVRVEIPYEKTAIPSGYTDRDVQVFFFDTQLKSWQKVALDSLDIASQRVTVQTTHFTDYIAGIIQAPESPETTSFSPTSISSIEPPNAATNIFQIAAPSANDQGDASLDYPIVTVPSRNGMEPDLNIKYNSGGGNGWLGQGWGLHTPQIEIDTRWGVPIFDPYKETESYMLNGEELMLETSPGEYYMPHKKTLIGRVSNAVFRPRVEGTFQEITRIGNDPTNYQWIILTKDGKKHYYGSSTNSRLTNNNGQTVRWMLERVEDYDKNVINYQYMLKQFTDGFLAGGKQLYLEHIGYGVEGPLGNIDYNYGIYFITKRTLDTPAINRKDITVSTRLGFKEITYDLLHKIIVRQKYPSYVEIEYELSYGQGAFGKTLLKSIKSTNRSRNSIDQTTVQSNPVVSEHKFDYYDDVAGGGLFQSNAVAINTYNDYSGFYENFGVKLSALGGTEGNNKTFGGGGSLGVVVPSIPTSYLPWSNSATIAGNLSGSWSRSETMVSMIDIDGDGLPDKVIKVGSKLFYRKNIGNKFSVDLYPIKGISNLSFSKTDGSDKGWSGSPFLGNYAKTTSKSNSSVYTFIEDVNADGLPDVVDNTRVYFNRLDPNTKLPVFTLDSSQTPNIVIKEGDVAPVLNAMPALDLADGLMDIVKVWRAPRDGVINIIGQIAKTHVAIDNGIRYSVEKGAGDFTGETTYLRQPQLMVQGTEPTNFNNISVKRGDLIFFRTSSSQIPEEEVQVSWNPAVKYVDYDKLSANKYSMYSSSYDEAFIVGTSHEFSIMKNGIYKLEWDSFAINNASVSNPTLSDDVTFKVTYYRRDLDTGGMIPLRNNNVEVYKVMAKNNANTTIGSPNLTLNVTGVNESSTFSFQYIKVEVLADSEVNWKYIDTRFKPRLIFEGQTNYLIPYYTNYGYVNSNYEHLSYTSDIHRVYLKHFFVIPNCTENTCKGRYVYLTIKENDHLLFVDGKPMKFRYTMNENGTTSERKRFNAGTGNYDENVGDHTTFLVTSGLWRNLHVEYFASDSGMGDLFEKSQQTNPLVTLSGGTGNTGTGAGGSKYWANVYSQDNSSGFGPMYRHWGQFAYKGPEPNQNFEKIRMDAVNVKKALQQNNPESNTSTQDVLTSTTPSFDQFESNMDYIQEMGGNISSEFSILMPNKERKTWETHEKLYVSETQISPNKRFLDDDIPLPRLPSSPVLNFGAYGIIKQTHSKTTSVNKSIGYSSFTIGQATNKAESRVLNDFRDINGDGYPDIVGAGIQMTTSKGGLSNSNILYANILPNSSQTGQGTMAGGGRSQVSISVSPAGNVNKPNLAVGNSTSGSTNGSYFTTKNLVDKMIVDVNGDGLPDLILNDGTLLLNIGNQFVAQNGWNFATTNRSETITKQGGGSSGGIFGNVRRLSNLDVAIGLSISSSTSKELDTYMDLNGDGLPDRVVNGNMAYLNTGTGFGQAIQLPDSPTQTSSAGGVNASLTFCAYFPLFIGVGPKFCISLMGSTGKAMTQESVRFMDFDGDGYPDLLTSTDDNEVKVQFSRIKRTNLLKTVHRPLGSTITMDYNTKNPISNTTVGSTYKMPFKKWVMTDVKIYDGLRGDGEDIMHMAFEYHNGYKDRRERKFLGFGTVKSHQLKSNGQLYRTQVTEYENNYLPDNHLYQPGISSDLRQYFFKKGLVNRVYSLDAQGNRLHDVQYAYGFFEAHPYQGSSYNMQSIPAFNYTENSRILPLLLGVNTKTTNFVDGNSFAHTTEVSYTDYDSYGNVTKYVDHTKGLTTDINYHNPASIYLKTVPKVQTIYGSGISKRFESEMTDGKHITRIRKYIDNSDRSSYAQYDMEYGNVFGELLKLTLPKPSQYDSDDMRMFYKYKYNDYTEGYYIYISSVTDAFGLTTKIKYNSFGLPMEMTDTNNQKFVYEYDAINRLTRLKGPYSPEWTILNEFGQTPQGMFYSLTKQHLEFENGDSTVSTTSFIDGLGRVVQTKKELEPHVGTEDCRNPGVRLWVSGKTIYDEFGRVSAQYLPLEEAQCDGSPSSVSLLEYSQLNQDDAEKTTINYDVQDRVIRQHIHATNATTSMKYGFARDLSDQMLFTEEVILPEGNKTVSYIDALGRKTANLQVGNHENLWTMMKYDPLGQLLDITDAENKTTSYRYNGFGQKTRVDHPDSGRTDYKYNLAGQLTEVTTAKGDRMNYNYELNRLSNVQYPSHTVYYKYGDSNAEGKRGRLVYVEDQVGYQEYDYGKLGEVIATKRAIHDFDGVQHYFKTLYTYDSWGRLLNMTYPDQEQVFYQYNKVGQLNRIVNNEEQEYLSEVRYTYFGQPEKIVYGNGVVTTMEYDVAQRMRAMQLTRPDESVVQRNIYRFNRNNQVIQVRNDYAQRGFRTVGGVSYKDFGYDEFNRLEKATGTWKGQQETHDFYLEMGYNKTHGIKFKKQAHQVTDHLTGLVAETLNNGLQEYEYADSEHAHAPSAIKKLDYSTNQYLGTKKLFYDANGNTKQIISDIGTEFYTERNLGWDEQNRLIEVNDNNEIFSNYRYDAAGERVLKKVRANSSGAVNGNPIFDQPESGGQTIYASGYLVVGESEYTKHYYANDKRIASRIRQINRADGFRVNSFFSESIADNRSNALDRTSSPAARFFNNVDDNNYEPSCEVQVNQLLNSFYNTPSRQHCRNKILEIIQHYTQPVQLPNGQIFYRVNYCLVLHEINRLPCVEIDPSTGWYVDPDTGYLIDPDTGYLVDPNTGLPIDPGTGLPTDPNPEVIVRQEIDCYTLIMQYLDYLLIIKDPKYMDMVIRYKEYTSSLTNCEIYDIMQIPPVLVEPPVLPPLPEPPLVDEDPIDDEWEDDAPDEGLPSEIFDESQRKPIWWYHGDHLGSSSYITDNFGKPTHFYEYLPFGELMVEQNQSTYYNNGYKFNAKELDAATGLYYYGARYYDPSTSIFLSVDPLAEQTMEPYSYVGNNPINFTDPTGMSKDGWRTDNETGERVFDKTFTRENTPSTHTYDNAILDGKNQLFYDESGGITPTGTVMENVSITKASSLHPYFRATPSGEYGPSSMKFESNNPYVNGAMNITSGVVGAVASATYIGSTGGVGAAAGGAIALTMSLGQIGIGVGQIADAASGGNNQNLQMSSNIPGLVARSVNSPHAGLIDAGAGVLTGSLQGRFLMGNSINTINSFKKIEQGHNVYFNSYSIYGTVNGYMDFGKAIKSSKK